MTSPREQAIEAARQALDAVRLFSRINDFGDNRSRIEICRYGVEGEPEIVVIRSEGLDYDERALLAEVVSSHRARAAIDAYESARARLDGAKMMPREVAYEQRVAAVNTTDPGIGEPPLYEKIFHAMHDATPEDGER